MGIKNIVVSVAGGVVSLLTAKYAVYLAQQLDAKLTAVYVVDEKALGDLLKSKIFVEVEAQGYESDLEEQGRRFLERVRRMAEQKGVAFEPVLTRGVVHDEVVETIKQLNADMLVMGELKEAVSRKEIFYDEGERIFRESPCTVVVVKDYEKVEMLYGSI
ncbi:MAG: universal stress protein [Candidatus Omnitrophica bacterium]|nr:universal stress protein [Candidatus Omnitrophota bacterium]